MLQFSADDIKIITNHYGNSTIKGWTVVHLVEEPTGYLGDHFNLIVKLDVYGTEKIVIFFVKCVPIDGDKAEYIVGGGFFKKEYTMLNGLFKQFGGDEEPGKWRPKALFLKEDLFVFEDVKGLGYKMPFHEDTLSKDEIFAVTNVLARFHAQTYIYEEKKSLTLKRQYRVWDEFSEYLQEAGSNQNWRNTGVKAVIDLLKVFSKYKSKKDFINRLDSTVPNIFKCALALMQPGSKIRNTIIHRDLWTNNIFFKDIDSKTHALIVDFQTVLYCSPMLDLSSMLYFNTDRNFREYYLNNILDYYYNIMAEELSTANIRISDIFDKTTLINNYNESVVFGITQAAIIVPIIALNKIDNIKYFYNPETFHHVNEVSRSEVFIEVAERDARYRQRVVQLFDELAEKYL